MLKPSSTLMFALFAGLALQIAACSGSDSSGGGPPGAGGGPGGGSLAGFSSYCTGKLKVGADLMKAQGAGAWVGNGSLSAPAGTTILVATGFDKWQGYVIQADGTPAKVSPADHAVGLVKGTEFTSDCATDDKLSAGVLVLLSDSTFHASQDLSGDVCTLPAGTELTNFSFVGGGTASVSSDEIKSTCGLDTSYSGDIHYAELILK